MGDLLSLALVVAAIAIPDSINPSLILADLYLAAGPHALRRTIEFVVAVFVVTFVGGVLILLGVAGLVSSLLPTLSSEVKNALITAGGVSLLLGGIAVWTKRSSLSRRQSRARDRKVDQSRPAALLGGGIAGVELLTAFPYFAAIGIIVGSGSSLPGKVVLLGIYNVAYVLPLIAISVVCAVMGPRASGLLNRIRDAALRRWPVVVAPLAFVLGLALTVLGTVRLTGG
jgi:cytochrome c biogenesis protein CcdA